MVNFDETGLGKAIDGKRLEQEDWLAVLNFAKWYNSVEPKIVEHDFSIVSYEHEYAGTLDLLLEIDGETIDDGHVKPLAVKPGIYVLDIKTGNENPDYFMQVAAYDNSVRENELVAETQGTMILYLDAGTKSGYKLVVRNHEEVRKDFDNFLAAKKLFHAKEPKLPELFEMPLGIQLQRF